ncbi:MAG: biotin--[acetyl-CoA-carboxylase] ligase, partial [Ruminiclostridium sp.]|nr:biotin--[acetyl-CoA-carboxylase] ligase [Ruminiclostridium sp.]
MAIFPAAEAAAALDKELARRLRIKTVDVTGSTNDDMRILAEQGEKEGSVIIAGEQTAGKGRHGHSFYSPKDDGLYMSIL